MVGSPASDPLDVVVLGAGFAGLYALHRLRGMGLSTQVLEAGSGVGGTWYWNRYPGARCDVESLWYSYSFSPELEQEWEWAERYATQGEILRYLEHVADRFDLTRDIRFGTRVAATRWDDECRTWTVTTEHGDSLRARFCVMATGCLSAPIEPDIPGLGSFAGELYHTGRWPHREVSFAGKRVAVVGTGSSGVQSIPVIAEEAAHVDVFQRTPNFSLPGRNGPLEPEVQRDVKARYRELREIMRRKAPSGQPTPRGTTSALAATPEERERVFEELWQIGGTRLLTGFTDLLTDVEANELCAEFVRRKIRETVDDQAVAELLTPHDHPIGAKRICIDTGYFETYNRENVTLVDASATPIVEVTPAGIRTDAAVYEVDTMVLATGFDAMTGALTRIDIRGRGGTSLSEQWAGGPHTYLGLAVAGFPNLFTVTGPGSPSVLSNMTVAIEQHVDWIADCLGHLRTRGLATIEATEEAEVEWSRHVSEAGDSTVFPKARSSWYIGANVPGKTLGILPYVGGLVAYGERCDAVAASGYEGFELA